MHDFAAKTGTSRHRANLLYKQWNVLVFDAYQWGVLVFVAIWIVLVFVRGVEMIVWVQLLTTIAILFYYMKPLE